MSRFIRLDPPVRTVAVFLDSADLDGRRLTLDPLDPAEWAAGLNRLLTAAPITFAGREPVSHPAFYEVLDGLRRDLAVEIWTRLGFDITEWLERVPPERFDPARLEPVFQATYDPRTMDLKEAIERALLLQGAGFSVSFRAVLARSHKAQALAAAELARQAGLDSGTVPDFADWRAGWPAAAPSRHQDGAAAGAPRARRLARIPDRVVLCRSAQLLLAPDGFAFGCRHHLLLGEEPIGRLTDDALPLERLCRPCNTEASCHPVDTAVMVGRDGAPCPAAVEITGPRRRRAAS